MDANLAIVADRLTKEYRLGYTRDAYETLRDLVDPRVRRRRQDRRRVINALDDVSFSIPRGEAIGVIGPNGAGKSTLLKILSRITLPTEGSATIRGRVGSLLEVGTGFHPELTGRENIYLNGAILGMRKREIDRKFDEIVGFAEVERFLDTPVKRYSSGMYVRLGFAVAAHLDVDILLVDEVLSVGDFGFQRRCLGKMQEQTSAEGRTVLFVSHNLGAVKALTKQCVWLDRGRIRAFGQTEQVFRDYVLSYREQGGSGHDDLSDLQSGRPPKHYDQDLAFESLRLEDEAGNATSVFLERDPVRVVIRLLARRTRRRIRAELSCRISTVEGVPVFTAVSGRPLVEFEEGELYETGFAIDPNPLGAGDYAIDVAVQTLADDVPDKTQDRARSSITLHIEESPVTVGDLEFARPSPEGLIRVDYPWEPMIGVDAHAPVPD